MISMGRAHFKKKHIYQLVKLHSNGIVIFTSAICKVFRKNRRRDWGLTKRIDSMIFIVMATAMQSSQSSALANKDRLNAQFEHAFASEPSIQNKSPAEAGPMLARKRLLLAPTREDQASESQAE